MAPWETLVEKAVAASSTSTATARTARPWEAVKAKQALAENDGMAAVVVEEREMEGE